LIPAGFGPGDLPPAYARFFEGPALI
jgi:hypothetical protein